MGSISKILHFSTGIFPLTCLPIVGLSQFPKKKSMAYCPRVTWNWLAVMGSILIRSSHFSSEIIILQNGNKVGATKAKKKKKSDDFVIEVSNE